MEKSRGRRDGTSWREPRTAVSKCATGFKKVCRVMRVGFPGLCQTMQTRVEHIPGLPSCQVHCLEEICDRDRCPAAGDDHREPRDRTAHPSGCEGPSLLLFYIGQEVFEIVDGDAVDLDVDHGIQGLIGLRNADGAQANGLVS